METERAIKLLDMKLQNPLRTLAAKKLKQNLNSNTQYNATQKRQEYFLKSINHKLVMENAMIVHADKGKTVVIINSDEYSKKVHIFLTENNFHTIKKKTQSTKTTNNY
jgi:uncharacterized SAM-dependent methyltransferase